MIRHDVEQGSPEWWSLRLGIPTASEFSKLMTSEGKRSTQFGDYRDRLLGEWLFGQPDHQFTNRWLERGKEMEPEARRYYEALTGETVEQVGFMADDEGRWGYSPDGLIGAEGLLEVKNLSPAVMVKHLRRDKPVPAEYVAQVAGGLLVTGYEWLDLLLYHPTHHRLIRVERASVYRLMMSLESLLLTMHEQLGEGKKELLAMGYEPYRPRGDSE